MTRKTRTYLERVPKSVFEEHLALFPIITTDIVVTNHSRCFLLLRRNANNHAWRGEWATPGGRILRNERLADAAVRILKRETGLKVDVSMIHFRGVVEIITPREHAVTFVYRTRSDTNQVWLDRTSSEGHWFPKNALPKQLREEYKTILLK